MSTRHRASIASIAATCICGAASASVTQANYAPCGSTEGIASFLAHVTYAYSGGSAASISIQLDNDTSMMLGGYITAVAINPATGAGGLSFVSCSNANFAGLAGPVSAPPYGNFAAGASTGGGWTGGGSPLGGIAAGSSALFVFSLTGSASYLGALTAEDVLGGAGYAMAVRFRGGAGNDWSDKVIGCALPAPGAVSLLGVAGLARARRRR
jgi:hypothetical protein